MPLKQLQIENWPIDRIRFYTRNLRKNEHAIDRMVTAITEFGFRIPLLVRSDGELIDGHLRLKAARKLRFPELPVIVCDDWSREQVKAFRLLVNRSASWAHWDLEHVGFELAELKLSDFSLNRTGFDGFEIDSMLAINRNGQEAVSIPELPVNPVTRPGDLWQCGPHRVLCGDATSSTDVAHLLGSSLPSVMITDPPYGVDYDPRWREQAGLGVQRQTGTVQNDDCVDWTAAYQLFPGDVAYIWHAGVHAAEVAAGIIAAGFSVRSQIIWAKQHFAMSRGHYHWQHEPCWYAVRRDRSARWRGDRKQSTVWQLANLNPFGGNSEEPVTGHGTQKPIELMRRPMLNHTEPGDTVYDPFLGSGTTLVAAEMTGRICLGLDIDPRYADVVVRRWQELTGKAAILASDQKSFADVERSRDAASEGAK